jgi:hypothetical protein
VSNWYEEMATAMRRREVAVNGVKRWETKVLEAEQAIAELSKTQPAVDAANIPAATFSAAAATGIPADYADSAE